MSISCSESSRDCIAQTSLKARASVWLRYSASFTSTEAECGRRGNRTRVPPSISPSVWENKLDRKAMKLRLEADHERWETRHTVSGRQSGRYGSCPACSETGEAGEQHRRRTRWRGSPGLSLLSRGVRTKIVRASPQIGTVGFETTQGGWDGSAQTGQE